jgi:hypothetical protein
MALRYGKFEKLRMRMRQSSLKSRQMSTTRPFGRSYKTLGCGKELWQIPTLPHSKMALQHYVLSSNLVAERAVQGRELV